MSILNATISAGIALVVYAIVRLLLSPSHVSTCHAKLRCLVLKPITYLVSSAIYPPSVVRLCLYFRSSVSTATTSATERLYKKVTTK